MNVYVVYGSPLSGKTTYVEKHIGDNDIVFDYDILMAAITMKDIHKHNTNLIGYVMDIRDLILNRLKSEKNIDNAWIITTRVTNELKKSLIGLNPIYVEMKINIGAAKERLNSSPGNRDIEEWTKAINRYFNSTSDYSAFYNSREWKEKRIVILKRDNYQCRECKRYGKVTEADTIHHVLLLTERPDLKLDNRNLISLCEECHERMHNKFDYKLSKLGIEWKDRIIRKYPEIEILG